ncbi:MAG: ergothioneine biosynthesis glutamate--cysteine ligase EgtA [Nocardioidaceae bacterium]
MSVATRDTPAQLRSGEAVHGYVKRVCFKTGPPELVGTELEWLVAFADAPQDPVPIALLRRLLDPLPPPPNGSRITYEPGGQLELSSAPAPGPSAAWHLLDADVAYVRRPLEEAGLVLLPTAIDPYRTPQRQLEHPRYAAMEAHFAAIGAAAGPVMMTSTAATQVNLDIGHDRADAARRWDLLHRVGPTLSAAFANSPVHAGTATGWKSARQRVWQDLDPQRTHVCEGPDPAASWAEYALDADLMLRRRPHDDWSMPPGISFRAWLADDADGPTTADLEYHLTTLFPPVRPRGWFEVRYVDALPLAWWRVPTAVLSVLLDDPESAEVAAGVATHDWRTAARLGLSDPAIAATARTLFAAAVTALARREEPALVDLVRGYADTYVDRGRCPADDPFPLDAPAQEA